MKAPSGAISGGFLESGQDHVGDPLFLGHFRFGRLHHAQVALVDEQGDAEAGVVAGDGAGFLDLFPGVGVDRFRRFVAADRGSAAGQLVAVHFQGVALPNL